MLKIKNYSIVTDIISDFSWKDVKFIYDIHYHQIFNEFYEEVFVLDLGFLVLTPEKQKYKLNMRFHDVDHATFSAGGNYVQTVLFEIIDIKDDGWAEKNFLVRDFERDDDLKFYCNHIEILSLEQSQLAISHLF